MTRRRQRGHGLGPGRAVHPEVDQASGAGGEVRPVHRLGAGVAVQNAGSTAHRPVPRQRLHPAGHAPQAAKDLQVYVDAKATARRWSSCPRSRARTCEQITTSLATGQVSAQKAASQYDADITAEAKQLGLPGW